jgi:hypothetical protein
MGLQSMKFEYVVSNMELLTPFCAVGEIVIGHSYDLFQAVSAAES